MLDKLLPPRLKKKPKKLQRQATFLDKPKESFKKRKYGSDFWELATFFVRGHLWHIPGPDLREQVQVLHITLLGKSVNGRRVAPQNTTGTR